MKIRILYFALLRDALGRAQEELEVPEDVTTVAGLREWLRGCGEPYATALGNARAACARGRQSGDGRARRRRGRRATRSPSFRR